MHKILHLCPISALHAPTNIRDNFDKDNLYVMFDVSKFNPPLAVYQVNVESQSAEKTYLTENGFCNLKKLDEGIYKISAKVVSGSANISSCAYKLYWNGVS